MLDLAVVGSLLMRFADPWQAEAAGRYIGSIYRENFEEPERLFELAQILRASQVWAPTTAEVEAFSAGFVTTFGAKNLVEVPRIIQAVEWSRVITGQTLDVNGGEYLG